MQTPPLARALFAALALAGLGLLVTDKAEGQTMPLQQLAMPSTGSIVAPPGGGADAGSGATPLFAGCADMTAPGGQQTVVIQNYATWNGVAQTSSIRVGPCTGLRSQPPTSANGIVLVPGAAIDWRVSAAGPCVVSDHADAGVRVGVVCGGGAAR
jgi:hypothetical protein